MAPRGVNPPDPGVLQRLHPSHRQLVLFLYGLYDRQQKALPRPLKDIANGSPLWRSSPSAISETLRGTGKKPPTPEYAEKLAEILDGSDTQIKKAGKLARDIGRGGRGEWVLGGDEPRDHLQSRATGHRPGDGRGGDLFAGRSRAVSAVVHWLRSVNPPGVPLVVTGQPGAGKSSVVARAALDLEAAGVRDAVFFHARGATQVDLLGAVRQLTGDASITDTESWKKHLDLRAVGAQSPLLIVVDALDEAAPKELSKIGKLLTAVAAKSAARVVVATRAGRNRKFLSDLSVRDAGDGQLIDLDSDEYFNAADLVRVAAVQLSQDGATDPGPLGNAWAGYRADAELTERLARVIARRAERNFLVAAFAGHWLSTAPTVMDPAGLEFNERLIPSSVEEAFEKYFEGLDEHRSFRNRRLLIALAYARGPGLDDDTWLQFTAALSLTANREDLLELRHSRVVDYLLETTRPDEPGYPPVTRLFHQALVDQLLKDADADDEQRIFRQLVPAKVDGWATVDPYVNRYIVDHAAAAGELFTLLRQPEYLAVADLRRVLAALPARPTDELREITAIVRQCVHRRDGLNQAEAIMLFAVTATQLGLKRWRDVFNRIAMRVGYPTVAWAHRIASGHQVIQAHSGTVSAVVIGRLGDRDVIVSAGSDGTVRIWDQHGEPVDSLASHPGACLRWRSAGSVAATSSSPPATTGRCGSGIDMGNPSVNPSIGHQ